MSFFESETISRIIIDKLISNVILDNNIKCINSKLNKHIEKFMFQMISPLMKVNYFYHETDQDKTDDGGTISTNFGTVEGKKVIIVDDVITSGKTVREVIHTVKDHGGEPTCVTVLIDKAGLSEIEEVPIESLIKVSRL